MYTEYQILSFHTSPAPLSSPGYSPSALRRGYYSASSALAAASALAILSFFLFSLSILSAMASSSLLSIIPK